MWKIGMFMNLAANDPEKTMRRNAFLFGLKTQLASTGSDKKVRLFMKHADVGAQMEDYLTKANDLHTNHCHIYVASCFPTMLAVRNAIQSPSNDTKIVIAGMFDPRRPPNHGPRVYGFISYDLAICDQWFSKLRSLRTSGNQQINKVAVIYDTNPDVVRAQEIFGEINRLSRATLSIDAFPIDVRAADLNAKISEFITMFNPGRVGGIIVTASTFAAIHRRTDSIRQGVIDAVNRAGLLAIYPNRLYVLNGGLVSIGADLLPLYQRAGQYAGRILNRDLPTQQLVVTQPGELELAYNFELGMRQLSMGSHNQLEMDADLIV